MRRSMHTATLSTHVRLNSKNLVSLSIATVLGALDFDSFDDDDDDKEEEEEEEEEDSTTCSPFK